MTHERRRASGRWPQILRDLQCLEGMVSVVAICVARLKQLTPVLRPHRLAEYDPTTLTADIKPMLCVALADVRHSVRAELERREQDRRGKRLLRLAQQFVPTSPWRDADPRPTEAPFSPLRSPRHACASPGLGNWRAASPDPKVGLTSKHEAMLELQDEMARDIGTLLDTAAFADIQFEPHPTHVHDAAPAAAPSLPLSRGCEETGRYAVAASSAAGYGDGQLGSIEDTLAVLAHKCVLWARCPKLLLALCPSLQHTQAAPAGNSFQSHGRTGTAEAGGGTSATADVLPDCPTLMRVELPEWLPSATLRVLLRYLYTDVWHEASDGESGPAESLASSARPHLPLRTLCHLVRLASVAAVHLQDMDLQARCFAALGRSITDAGRACVVYRHASALDVKPVMVRTAPLRSARNHSHHCVQDHCVNHLSYCQRLDDVAAFATLPQALQSRLRSEIGHVLDRDVPLSNHGATLVGAGPPSTMPQDLRRLLLQPVFADCAIRVHASESAAASGVSDMAGASTPAAGGRPVTFLAHRALLSCRSKHFQRLWSGNFRECRQRVLEVRGVPWATAEAMWTLLLVVYGGIPTQVEDAEEAGATHALTKPGANTSPHVFQAAVYYELYSFSWMSALASQDPVALVPAMCSAIKQVASTGAEEMVRVWTGALEWLRQCVLNRPWKLFGASRPAVWEEATIRQSGRMVRQQLLEAMPAEAVNTLLRQMWRPVAV